MDKSVKYEGGVGGRGFTLVELVLTMAISLIVILTASVLIVGQQKGYNKTFDRVYGDIITEAHVARRSFDSVCRKAYTKKCVVGTDYVEVYYFHDLNASKPDRYALFYSDNDRGLWVEHGDLKAGTLTPLSALRTEQIATTVEDVEFSVVNNSVTMVLTLDKDDDNLSPMKVVCSSVRHNNE